MKVYDTLGKFEHDVCEKDIPLGSIDWLKHKIIGFIHSILDNLHNKK